MGLGAGERFWDAVVGSIKFFNKQVRKSHHTTQIVVGLCAKAMCKRSPKGTDYKGMVKSRLGDAKKLQINLMIALTEKEIF